MAGYSKRSLGCQAVVWVALAMMQDSPWFYRDSGSILFLIRFQSQASTLNPDVVPKRSRAGRCGDKIRVQCRAFLVILGVCDRFG